MTSGLTVAIPYFSWCLRNFGNFRRSSSWFSIRCSCCREVLRRSSPTCHDGQRNYKILHWINILFHYFFPPPAPPIKCMLSSKQFSKCVDKAIEVNIPWILLSFYFAYFSSLFSRSYFSILYLQVAFNYNWTFGL